MAVTRADKEQELQDLTAAFKGADTAILVDYKGLNVPAVTELRRQIRGVKGTYKVVKNTLAIRASKGTSFEALEKMFEGTTAIAYTGDDAVALAKVLTTFMKGAPTLSIKGAEASFQTFFNFLPLPLHTARAPVSFRMKASSSSRASSSVI